MKYVIVTPAKNESKYIENTIRSVVSQTIIPLEWIIVDDGSTDDTVLKVKKYLQEYPWIKIIERKTKSEEREGGGKVIRAFNEGYAHILSVDYDFITKLDADLTLKHTYFEEISNAFAIEDKLGICGGVCYIERNNTLIKERADEYHVRGALKSIRKECFLNIGGFKPVLHWDGIDEYIARHKGWKVKSIDIQVIHHRPTSKAYKPLKYNYRNGYAARQRRASFWLSVMRSIFKMRTYPYVFNTFAYFLGYLVALLKAETNILDKKTSKTMNQFDYMKLFNKKKFQKEYL